MIWCPSILSSSQRRKWQWVDGFLCTQVHLLAKNERQVDRHGSHLTHSPKTSGKLTFIKMVCGLSRRRNRKTWIREMAAYYKMAVSTKQHCESCPRTAESTFRAGPSSPVKPLLGLQAPRGHLFLLHFVTATFQYIQVNSELGYHFLHAI